MNQPIVRAELLAMPFTIVEPWGGGRAWDDLARLLLLGLLVLAALTFQDYGITADEPVQSAYGHMLLSFYTSGFVDHSAFEFKDLFLYGGLFDLVAALLVKISTLGEYETRHLLCVLIGVLGIAGTWRLGRLLAGARAGLLAALLLVLSASWYGAIFNNTKDVPFATGMIWSLYYITRFLADLPRRRWATVIKLGLVLGLTLAVRVGAVLNGFYLAVPLILWGVAAGRRDGGGQALRQTRDAVVMLLPVLPIAFTVMAVFWPWAVLSPHNLPLALGTFARFPISLVTLFNGTPVLSDHPPALYLPVYLAIKLPESVLFGLAVALLLGLDRLRRRTPSVARPAALPMVPVILAAVLPVVLFMVLRPTIYNGIRHFLFVVPVLAVLAAIGLDGLWRRAQAWNRRAGAVLGAAFAVVAVVQAWTLVRLHPDEYVYYNQLVGGLKGAQGRWELDYWSNSLREATQSLARYIELENGGKPPANRVYNVVVCGHPLSSSYFMAPYLRLVPYDEAGIQRQDFYVYFTQDAGCANLLDGRAILEVARLGVPLAQVKDRRDHNLLIVATP